MKRLALTSGLIAALTACDGPGDPKPDPNSMEFSLVAVDGLAWGTHPFKKVSGELDLHRGDWTRQWTYTAANVTETLRDHGSYTMSGDTVRMLSASTQTIDTALVRGDSLLVRWPSLTFRWKRTR